MKDLSAPESTRALTTIASPRWVPIVIGMRKLTGELEETWDAARDHSSLDPKPTLFLSLFLLVWLWVSASQDSQIGCKILPFLHLLEEPHFFIEMMDFHHYE
jgi:hypothetical protein